MDKNQQVIKDPNEPVEPKKKMTLTTKIFIGLAVGAVLGLALYYFVPSGTIRDDIIINGVLYFVGQAFLRALQMLVVPLVFFSLSTGALSMGDTASLGKIGVKTVLMFLFTTAMAIVIALTLANLINPGTSMNLVASGNVDGSLPSAEGMSAVDNLLDMIPTNPFAAMANGNMLQVIIFAILVGIITGRLGEKASTLGRLLEEGNDLMMGMTSVVMKLSPYGVACLIARTFADLGLDTVGSMIKYMASVMGGLGLQVLLVYIPLLLLLTRLNPVTFIKKMLPAATFGFSTGSSGATIPITLNCMDNLGVSRKVSSFTIPLGATINMDGTAIMQGTAAVFIAQAYGISLTMGDFATVVLTATLASVGTAAVPGVGLVTLSMVLNSVGLPVEGIAVIMGVDRILDMSRTAINITGDSVVTLINAKQANLLDIDQYNDSKEFAGSEEY